MPIFPRRRSKSRVVACVAPLILRSLMVPSKNCGSSLSKGRLTDEARFDRWLERFGNHRRSDGGECTGQHQSECLPGEYVRAVRSATVGMAWRSGPQQTRQHVRYPHRSLARVWIPSAVSSPKGCGGPRQEEKEGGRAVKARSACADQREEHPSQAF